MRKKFLGFNVVFPKRKSKRLFSVLTKINLQDRMVSPPFSTKNARRL